LNSARHDGTPNYGTDTSDEVGLINQHLGRSVDEQVPLNTWRDNVEELNNSVLVLR
jgi:hypothetical protein